jgi:hypothetical protein
MRNRETPSSVRKLQPRLVLPVVQAKERFLSICQVIPPGGNLQSLPTGRLSFCKSDNPFRRSQ